MKKSRTKGDFFMKLEDKLAQLKKEYEKTNCPNDVKERMNSVMKKRTHKPLYVAVAAAAAVAVCTAALNVAPNAALAAQKLPVVGGIVRVLTFGRFEECDNGYEAKIVTPKITLPDNPELEEKLNREFSQNADAIKEQYQKDVEELKTAFGEETVHMGIEMNYDVLTDTDDILSLDIYIFSAAGSSSTKHSYYNINKKTNKLLSLDDVFGYKKNYRETLTEYILSEMKRQNESEQACFFLPDDEFGGEDTKKALAEMNKFYINDENEAVICFDKYEIAVGAQGCPEFTIPKSVLRPAID